MQTETTPTHVPTTSPVVDASLFFDRIRSVPPGTFAGCPTFLRALLHEAGRGGTGGYGEPGFHFGLHAHSLEPLDTETNDWADVLAAELAPLVARRDDAAVLAWLARRYPLVMNKVPGRRRTNFVAGFYRGFAKAAE